MVEYSYISQTSHNLTYESKIDTYLKLYLNYKENLIEV